MKSAAERYLQTLENHALEERSNAPLKLDKSSLSKQSSPFKPADAPLKISPIRAKRSPQKSPLRVITPVRATGSPNRKSSPARNSPRGSASPNRPFKESPLKTGSSPAKASNGPDSPVKSAIDLFGGKSAKVGPLSTPKKTTAAPNKNAAAPAANPAASPAPAAVDLANANEVNGRKRLQHTQENAPAVSWDRERKNLQAYEYLCHVGEAKEWMEGILKEKLPDAAELPAKLQDGVILAKITRHFRPELATRIFEHPRLQYRHIDNINCFFSFLASIGMPDLFMFDLVDLYERKNIVKVIYCIHALSHILAGEDLAPVMDDLVGKLDFTEDELKHTQRDLDRSGARINFDAMNRHFRSVSAAKLASEPAPEPGPELREPEPLDQVKEQSPEAEIEIDTLAEDVAAVKLSDEEIMLMELEALEPEITAMQASFKGALLRRALAAKRTRLYACEASLSRLQAIARGTKARNDSPVAKYITNRSDSLEQLQAVSRGAALRAQLARLDRDVQSHAALYTRLQTASRSFVARANYQRARKMLVAGDSHWSTLQAAIRGNVVRKRIAEQRSKLKAAEKQIVTVQSAFRGLISRFELGCLYDDLDQEIVGIVGFQARARAALARRELNVATNAWSQHEDKIRTIQNLWRARRQAQAYQSLIADPNPSLSTVKRFVHLLNDSDADYREEVELEAARKDVSDGVRANERLEQYIEQLDTKIALLLKNKISLDEVVASMPKAPPSELDHALRASGSSTSSARSLTDDAFDLKALNKTSRRRLELYQGMFYILQTKPVYLARLMHHQETMHLSERETKEAAERVFKVFAGATKPREEYFLLQLLAKSLQTEMDHTSSLPDFVRGNYLAWRMVGSLNKSKPSCKALKKILSAPVAEVLAQSDLDLESDPLAIYRELIAAEERSGRPSTRDPTATVDVALQDPETRQAFVAHLQRLRELTNVFVEVLDSSVDDLPYHIRYLAREVYMHASRKTAAGTARQSSPAGAAALSLVGKIVVNHYILPAMVAADNYGVVDRALDMREAQALGSVGKILSQCATLQTFGPQELYLQPLNESVAHAAERLRATFRRIVDIKDLQTQFCMTNLDDVTSRVRPQLTMKTSDILALHSQVFQQLSVLTDPADEMLRPVIYQLGPLPNDAREILDIARFTQVNLDLNPSYGTPAESASVPETGLLTAAKRCLIAVLMVQNGTDLMDVLVAPVSDEDEAANDAIRAGSTDQELSGLTFRELKLLTLEKVLELESSGRVSRSNNYQDLLNSLADDIRNKHDRRQARSRELALCSATLASLQDKHKYLQSRQSEYNDYIEDAMAQLQQQSTNNKKKSHIMPQLLAKLLNRDYGRYRNAKARFGAYRYPAGRILEKGLLVHLKGYSERQQKDVMFTFACDEASKFSVQVAYKGIQRPGGSTTLTLDDLLNRQYNNQAYIDLFDDVVRFNTNRLLQFIFQKFYGAEQ